MTIMASLSNNDGEFIFSIGNGTVLSEHQRVSGASFKQTKLLQAKPRQEISGGELERRELQGVCYEKDPDTTLQALFDLKNTNAPVVFVKAGRVLGLWTIGQVREQSAETVPNGIARKVKFSVQLEEFANA
jgi:phage protein U